MNSYIPVISKVLDSKHDSCLVDAEKILKTHSLNSLIIVSKSQVYPLSDDRWWFSIEEDNEQAIIVEHCPGVKRPDTVELIEILGHELTLLPGQKLLFHTDGNIEQTVSYIKLN